MATTHQTPVSDASAASQPQASIYVMPEQFLALTRAAGLPIQKAPPPPVQPQVRAASTPLPVPATSTPSSSTSLGEEEEGGREEGKRKMVVIWGIVGGIILIVGGLAAFLVLRSVTPPSTPALQPPAPVNTAPAPAPAPPADVAPAPAPATAPESTPEPEPAPPAADKDTDGDGLTDAEELLFGTDIALADTDRDGYSDATELANLYNPVGTAPQRLLDAGLVYEYEHPKQGWKIFLPRAWSIAATDQDQQELVVTTQVAGERVTLRRMEPSEGMSLSVLAQAELVGTHGGELTERATQRGATCYSVIPAEALCGIGTSALRLTYVTEQSPSRYPHVFDMIMQSFAVSSPL